ncbi:MAG: CehA/McbA family metallohydrolase [Clostridiales bacterium]|nr:CehA/McbA family metallohydrolase [Clostridiales bacterium]
MKLFASELHCHTVHSDGDFLPGELQKAAAKNELAIIALTDHNTKSAAGQLDESICGFITGIEWTTYFGHMLVLGGSGFTDWRDAVPDNIDEKTAVLQKNGAAVGVAHPFQLGSPMCTGGRWQFNVKSWENIDYIEIFHESFLPTQENTKAYKLWLKLLDSGHRLGATYGRDWHRIEKTAAPRGCTYIEMCAESPTAAAALSAIKAGRTVPSVGAELFFSIVQNSNEYHLGQNAQPGAAVIKCSANLESRRKFLHGFGIKYSEIKIKTNRGKTLLSLPAGGGSGNALLMSNSYYIAELWGKIAGQNALLAVTSPIYTAD